MSGRIVNCSRRVLLTLSAISAFAAGVTESNARQFLAHAAFGPTDAAVTQVEQLGYAGWVQQQLTIPPTGYSGFSYRNSNPVIGCPTGSVVTCIRDNYSNFLLQAQFFRNALYGSDQLRQRVALALSEIFVTSGQQISQPYAMANYQNMLLNDAFGNFRTLLNDVTLSPVMGNYLDMVNNSGVGVAPNENYAREVLQLFTIGLWQLNPDGSLQLDSTGHPIPSYTQDTVVGFAHAFTGWTYAPLPGAQSTFPNPVNFNGSMVAFPAYHDQGPKTVLSGVTLPEGQSPAFDLQAALDNIFQHPNVGPFISRRLIQQLVTSNPSPAYVARVAAVFNNNGKGVRGDLSAVVSAILLDPEVMSTPTPTTAGKLREPALVIAHFMRAMGGASDGVMLRGQSMLMGENVFNADSVFNFYPPDYPLPANSSQYAPPFGIFNANADLATSAFFNYALSTVGIAPDPTVAGSTGTKIDLSYWTSIASNPNTLVSEINRVLLAGRMSTALSQSLLTAINMVSADFPSGRATTALFLTATSPEYLVEQ